MEAFGGLFVLLIVGVVLAGIASMVISKQRTEQMQQRYGQVAAEVGLTTVDAPLGLSDAELTRFDLLPVGDRDHSAVWGMQGPATVTLAGAEHAVRACAFEWWWENRRTTTDSKGRTQVHWDRHSLVCGLVELPAGFDAPWTRAEREGMLNRMGIADRGDFQVESDEVNRAWDLRVDDPQLAIRLFDADFQGLLLGPLRGLSFELVTRWALVVGGPPAGGMFLTEGRVGDTSGWFSRGGDRVRNNMELFGALQHMRTTSMKVLQEMPASWWRAVGAQPEGQA